MRFVVITIFSLFILMWGCTACLLPKSSRTSSSTQTETNTQVSVVGNASDGLDLQALTALIKDVKNAEELERKINEPGGINNMDLNEDGQVDFIKVTEYGDKKSNEYGFSLTVEPEKGQVQEIAVIEIVKETEQAVVQVTGNQNIYGHGHHYSAVHGLSTFLLMGYLLSPHPFYARPWGWGYYPPYYATYPPVSHSVYSSRTTNYTQGSNVSRTNTSNMRNTSVASPNKGKVADSGIKKTLRNPTSTQKQFQARSASKAVGQGGFGRGQSGSSNSGSVRSGSSSRSFGGAGK